MRIGVHQLAARQQPARLVERGGNRIVRLVDVQPGEQRHPRIERAVIADRIRHFQSVLAAEHEVVLAGVRRDVHQAGAGLGGNEIAEQQRHVEIVATTAQRMRADGADQLARPCSTCTT